MLQNPRTALAVLAWQKPKRQGAPSSKRRTPQPMYSTVFLENLAALMLPSAEPEPSGLRVTSTCVKVTNPAIATDEPSASTPIDISCFIRMVVSPLNNLLNTFQDTTTRLTTGP